MAEADKLCDLLFFWLKKRKQCAEKLLALAKELENVHEKSTTFQVVGSATSIIALSVAGVTTVLTGGLATPLLIATTVGTIGGAAVDIASTAIEGFISSSNMKEAKNIMSEDEKIVKDIQEATENLKKKCEVQQKGTHGSTDVGCEVATQIMGALARRNNVDIPLDLLRTFVNSTFFQQLDGRHAAGAAVHQMLILSVVSLCVQLGIETSIGLAKSAAYTGAKVATKAGFKLLGVIGLGLGLYSFMLSLEEMLKSNQGTKASRALRDTAREIRDVTGNLEEQLNAMKEITQKMSELKNLIKSLRKYSLSMTEIGQEIINYVIQSCTDENVISWLKTLQRQNQFINLLCFLKENLEQFTDRLKRRNRGGHIDIVIVAHGEIMDELIPADLMMPTPTIIDTVLYSPWNCFIDARAACAITEGWKNTEGRDFLSLEENPNPNVFEPNPLPNHWNHMRRSLHQVPVILLTPVCPEEPVWKDFQSLKGHLEKDGRVIIPYLVPGWQNVETFGKIPFFMFNFALSYILMIIEKTATVHLAACLGRGKSQPLPDLWRTQYAYTYDLTCMTARNRHFMNNSLFRAFEAMFGRNGR